MLADLESLEKRVPAFQKKAAQGDKDAKIAASVLGQALELLREGKPARLTVPKDDEERRTLDLAQLLTSKPVLYVCNVDEASEANGNALSARVFEKAKAEGAEAVVVSAAIEAEIVTMPPEDRGEFLADLGLSETGLTRVIRAGYALLHLITFFTCGPKETRAWTVTKGSKAPQAAGVIHTDFERGFHDDLDYYLNAYSKKEIKTMRKQVRIWRMNFDKLMRNTIRDLRTYSEGHGMDPHTHDFTLPTAQSGSNYTLSANHGKIRAFMFGSITNPPARMQMERWSNLVKKYADKEVQLFVIYGDELHPGDGRQLKAYPLPKSEHEKLAYAQ